MELAEIRKLIDGIDPQLLGLFLKRMWCSDAVAEIKKTDGSPVLNPAREKEIIKGILDRSGDMGPYAEKLFRMLLELSRERQTEIIDGDHRVSEMWRAVSDIRKNKTNIVLIGMPGCGKTTVGAILGKMTGRRVTETDSMVSKEAGCSIPEIFEREGEAGFRKRESEAVARAGELTGAIIVTGGGTVTKAENYFPLHRNGLIYLLERDTRLLAKEGRPLSQSMDINEIYRSRRQMYLAFRDRTADNNGTPGSAAEQIWEDFLGTAEKRRF